MAGAGPIINESEGNTMELSDLQSDILASITSWLGWVDRSRFQAVSKTLRELERVSSNKFPWIIVLNDSTFKVLDRKPSKPHYYLYDPYEQKSFSICILDRDIRGILRKFESCDIMGIKLSWLLLNPSSENKFLLFNPFSLKIVRLPKILKKQVNVLSAFWYCPKSKSFMVYATKRDVKRGFLIIKRWKSGDERWETHDFAVKFPTQYIMKMEVVGEAVYCLFDTGVVGCFNDRRKSWSVVIKYSENDMLFSTFEFSFHTSEFRGELLMMDFVRNSRLWRLDQSEGRWMEVVQLDKCATFFSCINSDWFLCSAQFVAAIDPVATRIYYLRSNKIIYKHLSGKNRDDPDFLDFSGKQPSINLPYYWIEPPC